jgi:hypothetical protein
MATGQPQDVDPEKLARRGAYSLFVGAGACFAYFNSIHAWVDTPAHDRVKGWWLEPFMPALEPYLPAFVIALGIGSLAHAAYCLFRYAVLTKADR